MGKTGRRHRPLSVSVDYAQSEIQDIVYVELPEVGTQLTQKNRVRRDRIRQSRI